MAKINPVEVVTPILKASSRKEYVEAVKSVFVIIGKKTVIAALTSALPFFGIPPFSYLAGMAIEWVLVKVATAGDMGIFFIFVDLRVAVQHEDFENIAIKNYRIQQSGTKEEKNAVEKELILAVDNFVKLNRL